MSTARATEKAASTTTTTATISTTTTRRGCKFICCLAATESNANTEMRSAFGSTNLNWLEKAKSDGKMEGRRVEGAERETATEHKTQMKK